MKLQTEILAQAANQARGLAIDAVHKCSSGHLGLPLGAAEIGAVLYGHALRNALIPIITLIGLSLPAIVSGAVIVESIFNYPGMGLLVVQAAENTDVPLVLGTTLVATVATVTGSLLADILYVLADPRIRYTGLPA